ncbi:hypothetical protein CYMTET_7964 [Cymbomonas tetramitiformis]|uniref:Uncharacterized protein n=1 Tax=Cymbomonas tetramitiformis TaxID=36881 RepID=A0AAE0GU44_9CHLO|nr:hypothetical protein CYMTET_7964 [Cymbomonas tetramitiformis]
MLLKMVGKVLLAGLVLFVIQKEAGATAKSSNAFFGVGVAGTIGAVAIMALVVKRYRAAKENQYQLLLAALDKDFYKNVRDPLSKDVELNKVDLEDIFAHVMQVFADSDAGKGIRPPQTLPVPSPPPPVYTRGAGTAAWPTSSRSISFHAVASHAFVPWCARCCAEGVYHDVAACPMADDDCTAEHAKEAYQTGELAGAFHAAYDGAND